VLGVEINRFYCILLGTDLEHASYKVRKKGILIFGYKF
jgi:hypothetical protein